VNKVEMRKGGLNKINEKNNTSNNRNSCWISIIHFGIEVAVFSVCFCRWKMIKKEKEKREKREL